MNIRLINTLRERSEMVMLVVILGISAFLFIGSFRYSTEAAQFPRITSGITILGTLLLLGRDYLPKPLTRIVGESVDLISSDERLEEFSNEQTDSISDTPSEERTRPISDSVFTAFLALGYVGLGYLIGLLWASPIFVITYGLWFDLPRYVTVFIAGIALLLALLFMTILNLSLATGVLI